jgi:hypothetical protein
MQQMMKVKNGLFDCSGNPRSGQGHMTKVAGGSSSRLATWLSH